MVFYHGSPIKGINKLGISLLTNGETKASIIYLTPNRTYALFYIRDLNVNYVTCGVTAEGYIRYDERFSGQLPTLYRGQSGYLYKCIDSGCFEQTTTRDVWISKNPVVIESVEFIPDVYKEIIKYEASGNIKVIRYETLTDQEKHNIYEMTVYSLYKSGLTDKNTVKANFYRDNFPEAWKFVISHPKMKQTILEEWEKKRMK